MANRPPPCLLYDCRDKANVYPPADAIKVDDINTGVEEGANSGAWAVGLCETRAHDRETMKKAGAHFPIPGARDVPAMIDRDIAPRLKRGEMPGEAAA